MTEARTHVAYNYMWRLYDHGVKFVQPLAVFVSTRCHAEAMTNSSVETTHSYQDILVYFILQKIGGGEDDKTIPLESKRRPGKCRKVILPCSCR